jgi:hypothetical protein
MKRNILDITQKMFRNPISVKLTAMNLSDDTYWIFEARGWRFVEILREVEYINKWLEEGSEYFIIRDHPWHSPVPSGLFGIKGKIASIDIFCILLISFA